MAESMVVGRGLVEILPDFRKWGKQLAADMRLANRQMDGSAAGFRKSAATVGASLVKVGKGASLVGVGVAIAATKMAGDFQAETAVLQTAAGETSKGLKTVRAGILSISEGTGTGIKNLTDGMYTIEKAGFRGSAGLMVLKAAAQGAREENAKLSDVTNAMTSIMASYHLKATDSVRVMNAMKTAAGEGKLNMEEFSGAMSTVLPIASANKISFEQVAGAVATLTQHGTSAREATHELGATIRALASPNAVAAREMARFGLSSVDVQQHLGKRGLTGTIELLTSTILSKMGPSGKILLSAFEGTKQSAEDARIMISKMPPEISGLAKQYLGGSMSAREFKKSMKDINVENKPMLRNFVTLVDRSRGFSKELKSGGPAAKTYTDAIKKMSGGAIGLNTILQLSGESFSGFKDRVSKVGKSFHDSSKDVEGWKTTQKLLNVQLDMAKQRIQVLMINIGTKLIPVVTAIVRLFTEHKNVTLALVVGILGLVTVLSAAYVISKLWAVGAAAAGAAQAAWTIATMAQTDSLMIMRIQLGLLWVQESIVAAWTAITATAFWGLAAAILANPLTWIVVAIVAVVAGIVILATKTQFFQTIWKATWGFVKKIFWDFVGWFKKNWQLITFTIMTLGFGLAIAMIVRHWGAVKKAFSATIDWLKSNWYLVIIGIITGPFGFIAAWLIKRFWGPITNGFRAGWKAISDTAVSFGRSVGSFFSKLPGQLGHFFSSLPGIVGHWFVIAGEAIAHFFSKLPGRIVSYTNSFNKTLYHAGTDLISGLFHGATTFFTQMVPSFFKTLWHGIVDYFKNVFGIHSPSTVMAVLGVDLIRGLIVGMLKIASTIGTWLNTHVFRPVTGFFKNVGSWLVSSGRNLIMGQLRGQLAVANTIRGWLNDHIFRPVMSFFANAGKWLYQRGRDTISGLYNGFKAIWGTVSGWVTGRKAAITNALGNVGSLLYQKGRDVLNGLWSGLKSVWKDLTGWVSGIAKWIKDHKGPLSLDAKLLTPAGKALMGGLLKGLKIGFKGVGSFIYGTGDTVKDVIGKLKDLFSKGLGAIGLGKASAVGGAQQYAQLYMKTLGWGPSQWPALKALWMGESGWRSNAYNKSSGATGIPQALPGSKMASEGRDWRTNAATQIRWGEKYIKSRYGSPNNAYSAWLRRSPHWYDAGGIASRVGAMFKNTNKPERVLSPRQTEAFERLVDRLPVTGGGGGTTVVNAHFHNHGVIGSKNELSNWFVDSVDQLKRRGRL
jgi:TP901 family phage tail tape measure protein